MRDAILTANIIYTKPLLNNHHNCLFVDGEVVGRFAGRGGIDFLFVARGRSVLYVESPH